MTDIDSAVENIGGSGGTVVLEVVVVENIKLRRASGGFSVVTGLTDRPPQQLAGSRAVGDKRSSPVDDEVTVTLNFNRNT